MGEPTGFNLGAAVQDVLTRGLDYASQYASNRLQINNPTPYVQGPNGTLVPVGQSAVNAPGTMGSVPSWVWIAGGVAVGLAVLVPLLRR